MAKESEENFVMLNAKVSFPIPKEVNKADIEEICNILQVQDRPDLVEVMKNLVIVSGKNFTEENKTVFLPINKLPPEMLKKILGMLDIKSLCFARRTCKHWKQIIDYNIMEEAKKKISSIIIAGGVFMSSVEVLTGDLGTKKLPNLPDEIDGSPMVLHNGTILLCGGDYNLKKCLQLDHGTWKEHSTLNEKRWYHSAVTTQTATFLFGGLNSGYRETTYEYLPKDSTTWLMGKTNIPGGFREGYAIAVKSDQEIWLIGGCRTFKRILSFKIKDHTFEELSSQLNVGRAGHSCAFIPNTNKVMITGGYNFSEGSLDSVEILDTEEGSVTTANPINSKIESHMNSERTDHGMGVVTINGEERLAVFGGFDGNDENDDLDSVEVYNIQTEEWDSTDIKLKEAKRGFGFLSVKLSDVISQL